MVVAPQQKSSSTSSNNTLNSIKIVLFCVVSLITMQLDHRTLYLLQVKYFAGAAIYPLKRVAALPDIAGKNIKAWFTQKSALITTIKQLNNKQLTLEYEVQKITTLVAENRRLRMLLNASNQLKTPTLVAEVISVESNPYRHIISLNRGSQDQVNSNRPIIDTFGVVGQIIETTPFSSQAMLITDPQHFLPIQTNRNGIRGLAQGTGNFQQLEILNIPITEDIQVGDLLISSGLDGRFPQGYPVAIIKEINHDPTSYFAEIIATPIAQLNKTREVLIVMDPQENDQDVLSADSEEMQE